MSRFANTIFGYLDEVKNTINLRPLYLGGFSGDQGGSGGPPGGFQGYLPQTRVAYDLTEDEDSGFLSPNPYNSSGVLVSASLLDNLNHIRYRLGILEGSGLAGLVGIYVYDSGSLVDTDITILDFTDNLSVTQTAGNRVEIAVSGITAGSTYLDDLLDVNAPSPSDGNVLVYQGSAWVNSTVSGYVTVLDDLTDVSVPTPNDGEVLTYDSGSGLWVASPVTASGSGGSANIYSSPYASRPSAATTSGSLFMPTDSPIIQRSDGSVWTSFGTIRALSPFPNLTGFSWVNQGGASIVESKGGYLLTAETAAASDNFNIYVKSTPSTPYTVTATFMPLLNYKVNSSCVGLILRNSSSGNLITWPFQVDFEPSMYLFKYTNPTTYASSYGSTSDLAFGELAFYYHTGIITVRIEDNGTTMTFSISADGEIFISVYSRSSTDYITPDQIGIFANSYSTTLPARMKLLSWKEE